MSKVLDQLIFRVPGGFYGIVSVTIGLLGMYLSYLTVPGYSMLNNMVSELGVSPGAIYFNFGFFLSGLLAIPYYLTLARVFSYEKLNQKAILSAKICSMTSCGFYALVGVFPAVQEDLVLLYTHGTVAAISVISGVGYLLSFGYLMKKSQFFNGIHLILTGGVIIFYILFLLSWIPIIEWTASLGIILWIFINSLTLLYLEFGLKLRLPLENERKILKK